MWSGPALADVECGPCSSRTSPCSRSSACALSSSEIETDLQRGQHHRLIGELKYLVAAHPLHEWFHGQLVTALARSGRRDEALRTFEALRRTLRDELGLDPGPRLQQVQRDALGSVALAPGA